MSNCLSSWFAYTLLSRKFHLSTFCACIILAIAVVIMRLPSPRMATGQLAGETGIEPTEPDEITVTSKVGVVGSDCLQSIQYRHGCIVAFQGVSVNSAGDRESKVAEALGGTAVAWEVHALCAGRGALSFPLSAVQHNSLPPYFNNLYASRIILSTGKATNVA